MDQKLLPQDRKAARLVRMPNQHYQNFAKFLLINPACQNYIEEQALKSSRTRQDRNWRLSSSGFYWIESKPDNDPNAPKRITLS